MSLVRSSPAPYHPLYAMLAQDRFAQEKQKLLGPDGFAKFQLLEYGARSFGFWRDGVCIACAGLMPLLHPTPAPSARALTRKPLRTFRAHAGADPPPQGEGENRRLPTADLPTARFEAWFTCFPSLARDLRPFLRLAQLTLDDLPQDAIVEAHVAPGWTPGEKLARLLGFERRGGDLWERVRV